jgi:hypothetical protein
MAKMNVADYPGLPKWPQLLISGAQVTEEQAMEVIRRNDRFFESVYGGGNNREFEVRIREVVAMPGEPEDKWDLDHEERMQIMDKVWADFEDWSEAWRPLKTSYIHTDWLASAYVGGPNGWMHPDGTISHTKNVGKWPGVGEVRNDLKMIAKAFPFIEMDAMLMSGEEFEDSKEPLVGFKVKAGKVTVVTPDHGSLFKDFPNPSRTKFDQGVEFGLAMSNMFKPYVIGDKSNENHFALPEIRKWWGVSSIEEIRNKFP